MPIDVTPVPQVRKDAAYNNGHAVPTWTETFARYAQESAALRDKHASTMDLAYGPLERNRIDLIPGRVGMPCLVYLHGGYWMRNSREMFAVLGEGVMAHGWSCAMVGYTLAPEASLTQIVGEVSSALDFLASEGPRLGAGGPIVVSGWSAGGHLAAMAISHEAVRAGLAISGIFDLAPLADTYLQPTLSLTADEIADLSPARRPATMKPLIVAYGEEELPALVGQSAGFFAARKRQGAPGPLVAVAGAEHFSILEALRAPDGRLTRALVALDL